MIEHLLVYKSKTQYNLKISNIFLINKHKLMKPAIKHISLFAPLAVNVKNYQNYSAASHEAEGYNFGILPKVTM
jgi:hypothetical protein